jgi:integrase
MRSEILPAIGKMKVRDVTRAHIAALHDASRARPYAANRGPAFASVFFSWCERCSYRDAATNPCRGVERYRERKRERYLTPDELRRLSDALRNAENQGSNLPSIAAIRFLMLSGFREQEAPSLRWDAVNGESEFVTLEESKSGRSVRAVGAPVLQLLADLPRENGNVYVFPDAMLDRIWWKSSVCGSVCVRRLA